MRETLSFTIQLGIFLSIGQSACTAHVSTASFFRPWEKQLSQLSSASHRENVELQVSGATLRGYLQRTPHARAAVLYLYGNAGTAIGAAGEVEWIAETFGVDVLVLDYRGYGYSAGKGTYADLLSDAMAGFDELQHREPPGTPLGVIGFSLGSFFASHVASQKPVAWAILRAPATSVEDMVEAFKKEIPWYARAFVRVQLEPDLANLHPQPVEEIAKLTAPLLVVHGSADETVPVELGRKLFNAASSSQTKELCVIPEASHDDMYLLYPDERVRACVTKFLERVLPK